MEDGDRSEEKCREDSLESEKQANAPEGQEGGAKEASGGVMKEEQSEDPATGDPDKMEGSTTLATTAEGSTRDADSTPQGKEERGAKEAKTEGETHEAKAT